VELLGGIDFIIVAIGVFAVGEVMGNMEPEKPVEMVPVPEGAAQPPADVGRHEALPLRVRERLDRGLPRRRPPRRGLDHRLVPELRHREGVLEAPEEFGQGAIEGVAAPEGANNAETGGALVPLLTLGIPGSGTTAILLAALILWGFKPGPLFINDSPQLFWGLVASMYIGNVLLLILNLPLVAVFAQLLRIPSYAMFPLILGVSIVGVYSASSSMFHLGLLSLFGLLGYAMRKLDYPTAPLVLGLVLGDSMKRRLRQSLMMSQGDLAILLRPIPAALLAAAALLLVVPLVRKFNAVRVQVIDKEA
jgi:putative tricarboxylic transport membrane protein